MNDWIDTLLACRRQSEPAVLITVASTRGSVPREPGTRMVVSRAQQHGSIGGGHLELQAIGIGRDLLSAGNLGDLRRFPLGASLGQCCGGLVNLMFEAVPPSPTQTSWLDQLARCRAAGEACVLVSRAGRPAASGSLVVTGGCCIGSLGEPQEDAAAAALATQMLAGPVGTQLISLANGGPLFLFDPIRPVAANVILFGAGHVGQALVRILGGLRCRVTWIDERAEWFPADVAQNIGIEISDAPVEEVARAPADACYLVMTHSHGLDQALSEAILSRADFRYFGLIGSLTKRRVFEHRLLARGMDPAVLARMTCPIGIPGIESKEPAAIAVAVAAQLLRELSVAAARPDTGVPAGMSLASRRAW